MIFNSVTNKYEKTEVKEIKFVIENEDKPNRVARRAVLVHRNPATRESRILFHRSVERKRLQALRHPSLLAKVSQS
jgi:hypothetical protein